MGLCLSRKTGETIVIAGSIVIRVGEIGRGRVRLDDERKPAA